jgi:hypothetical protein
MNRFIVLVLFMMGITSCNSEDGLKTDNSDLAGVWNWTSTDGGLTNHMHATPASTGKTIQVQLLKNFTYSISVNGSKITNGTYELTLKKSIYSGKMARFIQCSENKDVQNIVLNGIITIYETSKLAISDNNYDGIGSGFVKIN